MTGKLDLTSAISAAKGAEQLTGKAKGSGSGASKPKAKRTAKRSTKGAAGKRNAHKGNTAEVDSSEPTAAERRRAIAAEQYGVDKAKPRTRAERMAERRLRWIQLGTEVTPEQMAKLDALAVEHGSIKAAVAWLIDNAKVGK